jgi:predicted DCC family thiol-disulfide oxidoreductase YuxK
MLKQMNTKVYYDGLCRLCSREIDHYRRQEGAESLLFIDINAVDFDAVREGLDPYRVHRVMHVRTADGRLRTGVDGFIEIWKHLPRYQWAARASQNRLLKALLDLSYRVFVWIRPLLPRKKNLCSDSPYCNTQHP